MHRKEELKQCTVMVTLVIVMLLSWSWEVKTWLTGELLWKRAGSEVDVFFLGLDYWEVHSSARWEDIFECNTFYVRWWWWWWWQGYMLLQTLNKKEPMYVCKLKGICVYDLVWPATGFVYKNQPTVTSVFENAFPVSILLFKKCCSENIFKHHWSWHP